jgi:hypothetical protein
VTSPFALTAASLLQGCLPEPTWGDVVTLNLNLAKLLVIYTPLIYVFIPPPWRLIDLSDSAFANSGKYSQNGFMVLLCTAHEDKICGAFCLLDFRSNKSKRVATSTLHAEALACIFGLESSTFVQSFLLELSKPNIPTLELLEPHADMIKKVAITDCHDLYAVLIAPAQSTSPSKHLSLYVAAIREFRTLNRIEAFVWLDTRDMAANSLTKLGDDKTVEHTELLPLLQSFVWQVKHPFIWGTTWSTE